MYIFTDIRISNLTKVYKIEFHWFISVLFLKIKVELFRKFMGQKPYLIVSELLFFNMETKGDYNLHFMVS